MSGDAWCNVQHSRAGLVSNQNLGQYDPNEPLASVAVCAREACISKGIKHVAGATNRTATYYSDAERRAAKS